MSKNVFKSNPEEDFYMTAMLTGLGVQGFAKSNFGCELTDIQFNRAKRSFRDNEEVFGLMRQAMHLLISSVLDEKNTDWGATDREYNSRNLTNK